MKVDLRRIIKKISKFPHSRSASLRFALRDCGNRTHLPFGKCVLFEISCDDITLSIGFFYMLKKLLCSSMSLLLFYLAAL